MSMEEIYKKYSEMVYRYLFSLTRSEDLAEELTQETFYQAICTGERFDGSCKISTWLCAVAKNVWRTYQRKHPNTEILDEHIPRKNHTEAEVLSSISTVELLKKVYLFEGEVRDVMCLRMLGDLSFREIGEILGKTENWARVTFYRGKEKLRKELEKDEK